MKEIRDYLLEVENYYTNFDETTYSCWLYILNIFIWKCSSNSREKLYLITLVNIEKTNAVAVNGEIIAKLAIFFNNNVSQLKIKLLVSDAALYAMKTGKCWKSLFLDFGL